MLNYGVFCMNLPISKFFINIHEYSTYIIICIPDHYAKSPVSKL